MVYNHQHASVNKSSVNTWNGQLVDYIVGYLGASQTPYRNITSKEVRPEDNKDETPASNIFQLKKPPQHFLKLVSDGPENVYIASVNRGKSLLHSILYIFYEEYRVSPWDQREYYVKLFVSKLSQDLERDKNLSIRLKETNLTKIDVSRSLADDSHQNSLKKFISVYFNLNLVVVNDDRIECQDMDLYKPAILLYQSGTDYFSPIMRSDIADQVLSNSSSPLFGTIYKLVNPNTISGVGVVSVGAEKIQNPIDVAQLSKLDLATLQNICTSKGIDIQKPAAKAGTFKNKTKSELIELLK